MSSKVLIIGKGSIGKRHERNLKALGVNVFTCDIDKTKKPDFTDLKVALKESWDAFIIATIPSTHVKIALQLNKPILMEKPLSHNLKDIAKIKVPVMMGYNLTFNPLFKKLKEVIPKLGKVYGVRCQFGQYLPDWHPKEDYSKEYSAKKSLGGGIILDDIHEIDLLYNLFGEVKEVVCFYDKLSNLKIETEDYAHILLRFKNNIIGSIQMDYLKRDFQRSLEITAEKGQVYWDLKEHSLKWFLNGKWFYSNLKNFDDNEEYILEVKYFLKCVQSNKGFDIKRGVETLKIALRCKNS